MLPQLQAERQIRAIEAAMVPHMDAHARAGLLKGYLLRAEGRRRPRSAVEALAEAGIAVVHVPATRNKPSRATGHGGTRRKATRDR